MLFGFPDPADSKACCEVVHQVLAVALHGSTVPRRLQQDGDHHSAVGHRGEPLPGLEERRRRRLRRISLSFSIFLIIVVVSIVARHRKLRYWGDALLPSEEHIVHFINISTTRTTPMKLQWWTWKYYIRIHSALSSSNCKWTLRFALCRALPHVRPRGSPGFTLDGIWHNTISERTAVNQHRILEWLRRAVRHKESIDSLLAVKLVKITSEPRVGQHPHKLNLTTLLPCNTHCD